MRIVAKDQWITISSPWWRHQMEIFSALLAICAGNSRVPGEFPTQRPVTRSFDVYFDLRPNKWLSKQSWGWWFETLSSSLWRHRNATWPVMLHRDNNTLNGAARYTSHKLLLGLNHWLWIRNIQWTVCNVSFLLFSVVVLYWQLLRNFALVKNRIICKKTFQN